MKLLKRSTATSLTNDFISLFEGKSWFSPTRFPYTYHHDYIRRNEIGVSRADVGAEMNHIKEAYGLEVYRITTLVPAILYLYQWNTTEIFIDIASGAQVSLLQMKALKLFAKMIPSNEVQMALCGDRGFKEFCRVIRDTDIRI